MSILNVEHLSHGFGDRAIFRDVSFRLLKGEHIGLVGANGEGKSTFMNLITGRLQPDEGKIEWAKKVRAGYLDQHTVLQKGMTVRQGQLLGTVGDTAMVEIADEPHLHMEMTVKGLQVDPLDYFSAAVIATLAEDTAFESSVSEGK